MGRSVSIPQGALLTAYVYDNHDGEFRDFQFEVTDPFVDRLRQLFPKTVACDHWLSREDHAVAENKIAWFGISEYQGLIAYWVVAKNPPVGEAWIATIAPKFMRAFNKLERLGTASNGEVFFRSTL